MEPTSESLAAFRLRHAEICSATHADVVTGLASALDRGDLTQASHDDTVAALAVALDGGDLAAIIAAERALWALGTVSL